MDQTQPISENLKEKDDKVIISSASNQVNEKINFALKPNIPEKIVICIDVSDEMKNYFFSLNDKKSGQCFSDHIAKSLSIFIRTKLLLNPHHEIAILMFANTAFWVSDFTRDVDRLIEVVRKLPGLQTTDLFDLSIIFDALMAKVTLSSSDDETPTHIYRIILLYGRHFCVPTFNPSTYKTFKENDIFTLDFLYLYNPDTSDNQCEEIFERLCQFDFHGRSYMMAASEGAEVQQALAQMLAHPLQRPLQKEVSLSINQVLDA